jgi:hypothetical protein
MVHAKRMRLVPAAVCGGVIALTAAGVSAAGAQPADPPGNNGTVKVDDKPFDDHPNNEPHVGCEFQIDFYGYDEGDLSAKVTFEAQPPTTRDGDDQVLLTDEVAIGEDPAGGGTDLDASQTYDLSNALDSIEPHPVQGWHVKLTVNAEGSKGADVKHKVFWISGCLDVPPVTTTSTTAPPMTTPPTTKPGDHGNGGGGGNGGEVTPPPPATPIEEPPPNTG